MATADKYDCMSCGRCCFGRRDYVQVFPYDAERLGPEQTARWVAPAVGETPASVGRAAEPQRFMKMSSGHCAALRSDASNHFSCSVYDARPTLCRALEPGSQACLAARARVDLGPALPLL